MTFVDVDDIVGAGAPGGNTRIIEALLALSAPPKAYVPVHDPALVEATWELPLGSEHDLVLRGTPGYDQPEVPMRAVVAARVDGELGRFVRLDVGSVHIAAGESPPLPIHPRFWRDLGLDPRAADVIVQKNFFHYIMFYAAISFRHVPVVTDGATSFRRVRARAERQARHPGKKLSEWRSHDVHLRAAAR